MSVWIARDKDGELYVFENKPLRTTHDFRPEDILDYDYFKIDNGLYPEVTWENSPKELVVKGK